MGAITAVSTLTGESGAQSQDALLDKLVSKGVLTATEAKELRTEADHDFKKAYQSKSGMPDWVTALKFGGDFRGRYDGLYNGQIVDRNRWRYRLRFGVTANLMDDFEVGFRLTSTDATASGGLFDPISQNQTLENNGAKKGLAIDLAYGKWTPIHNSDWTVAITAGKMENPFVASDLVFDKDYTPEGAAVQLKYTLNDHHAFRLIGGGFVLDEISNSSRDPYMAGIQARFDSTWDAKQRLQSSIGVALLGMFHDEGLTNGAVPNVNIGNDRLTTPGTNPLQEGFNPIYVDASLTYNLPSFPGYAGKFPITLAADYLHNPAAQADKDGYSAGLTFGKSGKKKTWDVGYRYKELQANAWYEETVDSDWGAFYLTAPTTSGKTGAGYYAGTNLRGHQVRANYSPFDSFTFGITYYVVEAIHENPIRSGSTIGRLQVDALWRF